MGGGDVVIAGGVGGVGGGDDGFEDVSFPSRLIQASVSEKA